MTVGLGRLGCACVMAVLAAGSATAWQSATVRPQPNPPSTTIVAGVRFGPIEETTSRGQLAAIFGAARLRDADVNIGEGYCTPGTQVMPGTNDALDVVWQDAARTQVAFVRVSTAGGRWATTRGVRIGTTLRELERLAGTVLTFSGFGWDYGGGLAWTETTGELGLSLDIDPRDNNAANRAAGAGAIFGDRLVRSDHPLVRRLRIAVRVLTQNWGRQFEERFCG